MINVSYGPIASALGLAQVAGKGQGFNTQAQRDLQALGIQSQMQGQINSNDANLIQMAMARDQAAQAAQLHQQALHQQQVQDQAQLELKQQGLKQQSEQNAAAQQTREELAKSLAEQRAQTNKEKAAKDQWLSTLTPEQRNAALSGAGIPVAKPPVEVSPNSQLSDDRLRQQAALEGLKFKAQQDAEHYTKLMTAVLPDPAAVAQAQKSAEASMASYQQAAQSITGPANVTGFTAAPSNAGVKSAPPPTQGIAPTGPSPYGVGGRKQMADGSVWTWNGVSWTKG